jgi:von Willebrand factor type A domain
MIGRCSAVLAAMVLYMPPARAVDATLDAPSEAPAGSKLSVHWGGPGGATDFVSIDAVGAADGNYGPYAYTRDNPTVIAVPDQPGDYVLRYHLASNGYPVVASAPLRVIDVSATLTAPVSAVAGSKVVVQWTGPNAPRDFISIDKPGDAERTYGPYAYASTGNPVTITAPNPGDYVIRYHMASSYRVIGTTPLTVATVAASFDAPTRAAAGGKLSVSWTGPGNPTDFISIDTIGAADGSYGAYAYTRDNPASIAVPDQPGDYVVRYHLGSNNYAVIASAPLRVSGTSATLTAPDAVTAGSRFDVAWTGPANQGDFISIDARAAPDRSYGFYAYTAPDKPASLRAPDEAGDYQLRYHTAQTYQAIAVRPIAVEPAAATVNAPAEVVAGSVFEVTWTGPDNEGDFVTLVEPSAPDRGYGSSNGYTRRGNPLRLEAPAQPGDYQLRYLTGQSYASLATAPLKVTTGTAPGLLRVLAPGASAQNGAVELLLDASGSMLQRIGGQRRIDLAKQALRDLIDNVLPAGSGFALRVFGHKEANSCRTDLEIAYAPLDRTAAAARIATITAMNLARTPIAASLAAVRQDLAAASGQRIVVLVTDGEETCDGNPRQAVEALRAGGADVRINIVGFAVDEVALKETFTEWARLGGGGFYSAQNGAELQQAIHAALNPVFEVVAGSDVVATGPVNGAAVSLPPGQYRVRLRDAASRDVGTVTISSGATQELKVD